MSVKIEKVLHLGVVHQVFLNGENAIYMRLPNPLDTQYGVNWLKPRMSPPGFDLIWDSDLVDVLESAFQATAHARAEVESAKQFSAEQQIKDNNEGLKTNDGGAGAEFGL